MIFDGRHIDEIQDQELNSLVTSHYSERQSLEFKATYSTKNDDDKIEILRDISSLANGGGGYLIVGIRDDGKGKAQKYESLSLSDAENIKKASQVFACPTREVHMLRGYFHFAHLVCLATIY